MRARSDRSKGPVVKRIGVIGGGAFGTALAKSMVENGMDVTLWCFSPETADSINREQINPYLPAVRLPKGLKATGDIIEAATGRDLIILAIPSAFLLATARGITGVPDIAEGKTIIACVTKGLINGKDGRPGLILDTLEDYFPGFYKNNMVYVSGPSHAEELAVGKLTALISACANPLHSIAVRETLICRNLKVFSSMDVRGVQICAAMKNVVAIVFGALEAHVEGSEFLGDNAESFLLAAGLNEMMILGKAMGATHAETFTSIAGIGDLDVTCRSVYGRNRRFGRSIIKENILAQFKDINDLSARVMHQVGYLPEGVFAASAAYRVAEEYNLKTPIFKTLYKILNREEHPLKALDKLIN